MADATAKSKPQVTKPEKPNEEQYKEDLAKAEKELSASQEKLNAVKAKLDLAKPANKDSPTAQKQKELRDELSSIRQKQAGAKSSRSGVQERLRKLDEQIKSRLSEHKTARGRMGPYKTAEDVDREIARLQAQVDAGTMKLVEEKKTLADVSALHKTKKGFAGLDAQQRGIDDLKAQAADLRKQLDDPDARALSDRYTEVASALDALRAEQDGAFKNLNALRDERSAAQKEQQERYAAVRALKDRYFGARRAAQEYEREAQKARRDRFRAEREAQDAAKRRAAAAARLEEAGAPAYGDEINAAEGLIRYFDPAAAAAMGEEKKEPSKFAAEATRKVDEKGIKGMRLAKREDDENYLMMGSGGKKGKKGKKGGAGGASAGAGGASPAAGEGAATEGGKFNLSMGIIEQLASLNIEPPMNQSDVPSIVEKLQEKLSHWREDQSRQTKENVDKAQKEIDRLEAEAKASNSNTAGGASTVGAADATSKDLGNKPAAKNQGPDGDANAQQEKDAVVDAAEEMEKATIEDAEAA